MNEKDLITEFTERFDSILKGDQRGLEVKNIENKELLTFADQISKIDYSNESKNREILKSKLLKMLKEQNNSGELNDDELDAAAGGLNDFQIEDDPEK